MTHLCCVEYRENKNAIFKISCETWSVNMPVEFAPGREVHHFILTPKTWKRSRNWVNKDTNLKSWACRMKNPSEFGSLRKMKASGIWKPLEFGSHRTLETTRIGKPLEIGTQWSLETTGFLKPMESRRHGNLESIRVWKPMYLGGHWNQHRYTENHSNLETIGVWKPPK